MNHNETVEALKESYRKKGPMHPVIETQFGIAGGNTRLEAVPEWPRKVVTVKNKFEHITYKVIDNIRSDKSEDWWREVILEAAEELMRMGVEPGQIAEKLLTDFPLGKSMLYKYLPERFKNPEKVKAGKASAEVRKSVPPAGTEVNSSMQTTTESSTMRTAPQSSSVSTASGYNLAGTERTYPISNDASKFARKTFTPWEQKLQNAFSRQGFMLEFQKPIPMPKWKCGKCRREFSEPPPHTCPNCGIAPERLDYHVDLVLDGRWGIEPGGKKHSFDSDLERDAYIKENAGITLYHYDNKLVDEGAWLIVEYHKILKRVETVEQHTLLIDGHVRHLTIDDKDLIATMQISTSGPAQIKVQIK